MTQTKIADSIEENIIDQVLEWIGFTQPQRNRLTQEFDSTDDIREWTNKDVNSLAESFAKRSGAEGKMYFGMARTKRLKSLAHWVRDFERVSKTPTIKGLNQEGFRAALQVAAERAGIRKQEAEHSSTINQESTPGKLKTRGTLWIGRTAFRTCCCPSQGCLAFPCPM